MEKDCCGNDVPEKDARPETETVHDQKKHDDMLKKLKFWKWTAGGVGLLLLFTVLFDAHVSLRPWFTHGPTAVPAVASADTTASTATASTSSGTSDATLAAEVMPAAGVDLHVKWGDLGKKLVAAGVIDDTKFTALYAQSGGLTAEEQQLLTGSKNGDLRITQQNSGVLLNLLWAFGLANKNAILDNGPMNDPQYGGAGGFASTGGWTIGTDNAMTYYSTLSLVKLTAAQQQLVEKVSKTIYRPCCGNSAYFPDCNHGMAMLGLLELMASQGATEAQMYNSALAANSYWFPSTYVTIAKFLDAHGVAWSQADPKEVLGAAMSSSSGYSQILSQVQPAGTSGGSGCGV